MSGTDSKSDIAVLGTDGDGDSLRQPLLLDVQPSKFRNTSIASFFTTIKMD